MNAIISEAIYVTIYDSASPRETLACFVNLDVFQSQILPQIILTVAVKTYVPVNPLKFV